MELIQTLRKRLGFAPPKPPIDMILHDQITFAKRAKYGEAYDEALKIFEQSLQLAKNTGDNATATIIQLHRADILISLGEYEETEHLLNDLRQRAENTNQRTQLAYTLCSLGVLEQSRHNWEIARKHYEKAREVAHAAYAIGAEGRAEGHLADTYLHENNAAFALHLLKEALPHLEVSGDIEMGSYFVGRLGQAMIASGQTDEGRQILERAMNLAEKMQHRPYMRRWLMVLGDLALELERYEDAKTYLEQALSLFGTVSPKSETIAALVQAGMAAFYMKDYAQSMKYASSALAIAQDEAHGDFLPKIHCLLGLTLQANGQSADALPYLEASAQAYQQNREGDNSDKLVDILRYKAAAQADLGELEAAILTYRTAIQLAQTANLAIAQAKALSGLAMLQRQNGNPADAIQAWTQALDIYSQQNLRQHIVRLYCDIGESRIALGQRRRAIRDYEQALINLSSIDDLETRGVVLANAAAAYVEEGDIDSTESFFKESIEIAETLEDKTAEASRRNNYGWFLLMIGELEPARHSLEQARQLSKVQGEVLPQAIQTDNLGLVSQARGAWEKAAQYHQDALTLLEGKNHPRWRAHIEINLANAHLSQNNIETTEPLLTDALKTGRKLRDIDLTVGALIGLTRYALLSNQIEQANITLTEAITMARQAEMRRLLAEALSVQSQLEAKQGLLEAAQATWDEAQKLFTLLGMPVKTATWLSH